MKKVIFILLAIILLFVGPVMAANTITTGNGITTLSSIDSDWTASDFMWVKSIEFRPGATSDILIIKNGSDAGPQIMNVLSTTGDTITKYFDGTMLTPMLDISACTITAGGVVIILYESR